MGNPVNNISMATFLGTALANATPGVEQNRPIFTLQNTNQAIAGFSLSYLRSKRIIGAWGFLI